MTRNCRKWSLVAFSAAVLLFGSLSAEAAPSGFNEGVAAYNARNYRAALSRFQQAAQAAPRDASIRYYMGLCYQGMNQMSLAKQEYQWVAASGTPALRSQATAALSNLSRYPVSYSGSSTASPAAATSAASGQRKIAGRLKVYDFYTVWCGPCKRFEPIFEAVSRQMRDVDFKRLDAEDDANASFVKRYNINAYPTVIYADANGNELGRTNGFATEQDFAGYIRRIQGGGR